MTKPVSTIDTIVARAASRGLTTEEYLQLLIHTEDQYKSLQARDRDIINKLQEEIDRLKEKCCWSCVYRNMHFSEDPCNVCDSKHSKWKER